MSYKMRKILFGTIASSVFLTLLLLGVAQATQKDSRNILNFKLGDKENRESIKFQAEKIPTLAKKNVEMNNEKQKNPHRDSGDPNYPIQIPSQDRSAISRLLILEQWQAYRTVEGVCVRGIIRNTSRMRINQAIYAIAEFYDRQGRYIGSKTELMNPRPFYSNQAITFTIEQKQNINQTQTVKLSFKRVSQNSSEEISFTPKTNQPLSLPVRQYNRDSCPLSKN